MTDADAALYAMMPSRAYRRDAALRIEAVARDSAMSWETRRLAALMLETALSAIRDRAERRFWLERLGLTDPAELQRQGFARRPAMEIQLWRRFERMRRIHRLPPASVRDYVHASRHECRLTLARCLFGADEVIARIEQEVRRSEGIPDHGEYGQFRGERDHAIENLPAMERAIVEHLARDSVIRWASPETSGAIDALAAQPLGTVVLVIRPPGSTHEIQIKRAGRPRPLPLDVVWKRNGNVVSTAHHLDGGSEHNSIAYEAESAAFFSRIFREVHGFDAPMTRSVTVARVDTVPTTNGDADLMEYFSTLPVFGERFYEMRWNLYHAVRTLSNGRIGAADDAELTREFIRRTKPAQAIQIGTTALRLDLLHRYLSAEGAEAYFERGLGVEHDADDDRRFADHLLDEVLGIYQPPPLGARSYRRYVDAAFRVPRNRARADRVYLSLLQQIGRFWGTLLAVRGHSRGESFVERNVGLRCVWADGRWQVRIVFMDHDSLIFGTLDTNMFRPRTPLEGTIMDADHILGGVLTQVRVERGEIGCLREIYRIAGPVHRRAMAALRVELKSAYDRTHAAIRRKPALAALFPRAIVPRLGDWDEAVRGYLHAKSDAAQERWSAALQARLLVHGYDPVAVAEHVDVIRNNAPFLRRLAFLFDGSAGSQPAGAPAPLPAPI